MCRSLLALPHRRDIRDTPIERRQTAVAGAAGRSGQTNSRFSQKLTRTAVQAFYCGIDADNQAGRRCAAAAGFRLLDPPDFEDTLCYGRTREPNPR